MSINLNNKQLPALPVNLDKLMQLYKATVQPEGRLFFAGEHCSNQQAWIQGVVISALTAVENIVLHKARISDAIISN